MNTLKITPINEMLTERHNLKNAKVKTFEIKHKEYSFYTPCNLNIYMGPSCNCHCKFCFADALNHQKDINDSFFLESLERNLELLEEIPIEVTITGGEPTLYTKRLLMVMDLLKERNIPERTFSTNGIGLMSTFSGKPMLQHMKEHGILHNISVSRMAAEERENKDIFCGDCISNHEIARISEFTKINRMDMRLSSVLMDSGLNSWEKIKNYISFYESIGIESFIFREIVGQQVKIKMEEIVSEMLKEKDVEFLKSMDGIFYTIMIYKRKHHLLKHYIQKEGNRDIVSTLVFHNGILYRNWNGDKI